MTLMKSYTSVCCILTACLLSTSLIAENLSVQDKRKATNLLNFTRFAKWQDETFNNNDEAINLCLSNQGEFKKFLQEKVHNRRFGLAKKTINILTFSDESKNEHCHLSYIVTNADAEKISANKWLKVGDNRDMAKLGTAINFIIEAEEVHFEIYPSKLKDQNVSMSSELLKLATIIEE